MTITETKPATVGSKKAAELQVVNNKILISATKRTKFSQVAAGVCPHDGAPLLEPVRTKGVGFKAVCSQCGHTWYLNKKIKTCGCLTCKGAKRNSTERKIANRIENQSLQKVGGPLWTRTRDPSLIRTVL
jgi:protein-arginine kinase activator protein McsA